MRKDIAERERERERESSLCVISSSSAGWKITQVQRNRKQASKLVNTTRKP
jgi:hypothetical protein